MNVSQIGPLVDQADAFLGHAIGVDQVATREVGDADDLVANVLGWCVVLPHVVGHDRACLGLEHRVEPCICDALGGEPRAVKAVPRWMDGADRDVSRRDGVGPDLLMARVLRHHVLESVRHHPSVGAFRIPVVEAVGGGQQRDLVAGGQEHPHRLGHPDLRATVQVGVLDEADVHQ